MPKKTQKDPRYNFAPFFLPWIVGAAMFVVYFATLNHWITLLNLMPVVTACGWVWQPQFNSPLTFLATLPFHWLPAASVPAAMNLFSAVCAALVAVLLARSVALLPQDQTEPQRQREKSDFSFLTGWPACFPPVIAVLFTGLQLTFWKHATNFTGEMFDLLMLATIIWLLLEYRLDESPWRLTAALVLFGAGIAESWMFLGLFPLLVIFLIWQKRLDFFSVNFLIHSIVCGLAGLSLIFLLPALVKFHPQYGVSLLQSLKISLRTDWQIMNLSYNVGWLKTLAEASLSTMLPALVMAVKWSAGFGDNSRIGAAFANAMVNLVYAALFSICVWATFDPAFSAGQILSLPCLSLSYLAALSLGYFCGYFLLVFGQKAIPTRRDPRPAPLLPQELMWICPIVVVGVFAASLICLGTLIYRNLPLIRVANSNVLLDFARTATLNLPPDGAILFADSDNPTEDQSSRAYITKAFIAREGRSREFPVVDTQSLNIPAYHNFLHREYPAKWPAIVADINPTNYLQVSPYYLYNLLGLLSNSNNLCYLNPSYGYYLEKFYQEPHGMAYVLKDLPANDPLPPPLDKSLIAENETFWARVIAEQQPAVLRALDPQKIPGKFAPADWLLAHLHPTAVADENAILVGTIYSRALNNWGVLLQRAGQLEKAAAAFEAARKFNPDNVVAEINAAFNQTLRAGTAMAVDLSQTTADRFGKYSDWNAVVNANGPFDEISFCYQSGVSFNQAGMFNQAAQQFNRVSQLSPANLDARMELVQIYLRDHLADRAMETLQPILDDPARYSLNESNSTPLNILVASVYFQKDDVNTAVNRLNLEVSRHPDDDTLLQAVTQAYFMRGLFTNALKVIHMKLARSPDDAQWLYGLGYASIETGRYDDAIKAMTHVMEIQTNAPTARFNRALAYFKSDQLDNARADYSALQGTYTNAFQIAYGLGQIADRQLQTNEAMRNYTIYLANAPTNTLEFTNVVIRVSQLRGH